MTSAPAVPAVPAVPTLPGAASSAAGGASVPAVSVAGLLQSREVLIIGWLIVLGVLAGVQPRWAVMLAVLSILGMLGYMHKTGTGVYAR